MTWVDTIFSIVWDIADWFYDAYLETRGWVVVGPLFSTICYALYRAFRDLLTPIAYFGDWVDEVWELVQNILNFDTIKALLKQWLDWAAWAWQWVQDAWYIVQAWISARLETFGGIVKGWIAVATQGLNDIIVAWSNFWTITWPQWMKSFDALASAWDNFWTVIFPNLVNFSWLTNWWNERVKDVQALIESTIKTWFPFYNALVELWSDIQSFFTDPCQWVYDRLDDFFERFW